MICPNCGATNIDGSTFCVKCGNNLAAMPSTPVMNNEVDQNVNNNVPPMQAPVNNTVEQVPNNGVVTQVPVSNKPKTDFVGILKGYFAFGLGLLTKPVTSFKDEESKFNDTKNALMFSGFIAILMMLLNFIISVIIEVRIGFSGIKYSFGFNSIDGDMLVSLILKRLLIYAAVIAVIALVYYLVCLVFKKSANYMKLLTVVSSSMVPYALATIFVSPICRVIWIPLGLVVGVVGIVYSILLLVNLMNECINFDNKDMKIIFHLICISVIIVIAYIVIYNMASSSLSSLGGLF